MNMTMIAYTSNFSAPIVLGDLLISSTDKPDGFHVPVLPEDVFQYVTDPTDYHPIMLSQKIYIIKPNICVAFAGAIYYIRRFIEDFVMFCNVIEEVTSELIKIFMENHLEDEDWKHFSFLILVSEKKEDYIHVGRFIHGSWLQGHSDVYGDFLTAGSGSGDFAEELIKESKLLSGYDKNSYSYALQVNTILISRLLATERLNLDTIRKHWGAGFEMVYFEKGIFTKLSDITYVINSARFYNNGDLPEIPVPIAILNYKYHGEILVISVIQPIKGTSTVTDTQYIISSDDFKVRQFIVAPLGYESEEVKFEVSNNLSFSSHHNAMSYIIKTSTGNYIPANFNIGPELEVKYTHPKNVTITMEKEVLDRLAREIKPIFKWRAGFQ